MPVWYKDPETGNIGQVDDDIDEQGRNLAQIGLREGAGKSGKKYITGQMLVSNERSKKPGTSVFVPDEELSEAIKSGKFDTPELASARKAKTGIGAGESALRGAAQVMTWGAADEIQGAIKAPFSDKTYGQLVDEYRLADKAAWDEQPAAMIGGSIIAGAPTAALGAGKTLLGVAVRSAGIGGVTGFNSGEDTLSDRLKSATVGAVFGAAAPVAMHYGGRGFSKGAKFLADKAEPHVSKATEPVKEVAQDSYEYLKGALGGARQQMREGVQSSVAAPFEAAVGAVKAVKDANAVKKEVRSLAEKMPRTQAIGSGKQIKEDPSDRFFEALLSEGDDPVKDFVIQKAATMGGEMDADLLRKVIAMGSDRRNAARSWDAKVSAKKLEPEVAALQDEFQAARDAAFRQLQAKASSEFGSTKFLQSIDDLLASGRGLINESADRMSIIPSKNQQEIRKALEIIDNGSLNVHGVDFSRQRASVAPPDELFERLQTARQLIDEQRDFFAKNGQTSAERTMLGFRAKIDNVLKQVESKQRADMIFSRGKEADDLLFGATEFRNKTGRSEVDEYKIARLFGGTDTAGRFGEAIEKTRKLIAEPEFEPVRGKLTALLDKLDAERSLAADKRLIDALRFKQGPTSPAVNLQSHVMNRAGLPSEAILATPNFLTSADQFLKAHLKGRQFKDLAPDERLRLIKMLTWHKYNPKAGPEETSRATRRILGVSE